MIVRHAHAKLNVFLRILRRREDGYHDVETLLLPIALHDVVTVEAAAELEVVVTGERAGELADRGGESLVAHAARVWSSAAGVGAPRARITVDKRIPVAAGLGGGSADAAAAILALEELAGGRLDDATLLELAAEVGSDVPPLLLGGPVFAHGRGDRCVSVHATGTHWAVRPLPFAVAAADAYAWWDDDPRTGPDPGALVAALETGNAELAGDALFDDLQAPVAAHHPEVDATVAAFLEAGALGAVMSGSGPSVVALARDPMHADALCAAVPGSFATSGPPRTMDPPSGVV
ncbi:MAG TPA: 4-(cytidine 5'-diphospho)-2-C-methyl-D-erythritol kinase [Actinomycetota bacterium]|nr:4-(cytidine 5'-diphospho)-2-C-methyl-D-erythritol kinase [Actinomycetota bacterium]